MTSLGELKKNQIEDTVRSGISTWQLNTEREGQREVWADCPFSSLYAGGYVCAHPLRENTAGGAKKSSVLDMLSLSCCTWIHPHIALIRYAYISPEFRGESVTSSYKLLQFTCFPSESTRCWRMRAERFSSSVCFVGNKESSWLEYSDIPFIFQSDTRLRNGRRGHARRRGFKKAQKQAKCSLQLCRSGHNGKISPSHLLH